MQDPPKPVLEACDCNLIDVDREILAILDDEGARTTGYLDKNISADVGRSWISKRLTTLSDHGPVERVGRGLYEIGSQHTETTEHDH